MPTNGYDIIKDVARMAREEGSVEPIDVKGFMAMGDEAMYIPSDFVLSMQRVLEEYGYATLPPHYLSNVEIMHDKMGEIIFDTQDVPEDRYALEAALHIHWLTEQELNTWLIRQ